MEKIILLGGNHISNLDWVRDLEKELQHYADEIILHKYLHWLNPDLGEIDFDKELANLSNNILKNQDSIVIAKSAGTILALYAIQKGLISPKKIVLIGVPHKWALERNHDVKSLLRYLNVKTLIIQQSNDYMMPFRDLISLLKDLENTNINTVEIEGNDHAYLNIADFIDVTRSFITE
jgi:pimeloyl-ACP methyl ester carboxylesterase